jgi:hypothetical protein
MLRVQAYITSQTGRSYTVEARAEGIDAPFIFNIDANSDREAAMEAIRRVEAFDANIAGEARKH